MTGARMTDRTDMRNHLRTLTALAASVMLTAGCDALDKLTDKNPTSPSPSSVSLEAFAGTWTSTSAATPATGCGNLKYTVTPLNTSSANVTFAGTCAGNIQVTGTGTGKVNGSTLEWSAQGLVGQGGINCPFTFPDGKATEEAGGGLKVVYSGTVCGIPVSGSEIVRKP